MSDETETNEGPHRPWRLMIGLVIIVGGFFLVVNSATEGGTYFLTVDQAMAAPPPDRPVRIKGLVTVGTYKNTPGTTVHDFEIKDKAGERSVKVHFEGPIPDVFKEGAEVVATGKLGDDGVLTATEVTAKCPSKYEEGQMSETARQKAGLSPKS